MQKPKLKADYTSGRVFGLLLLLFTVAAGWRRVLVRGMLVFGKPSDVLAGIGLEVFRRDGGHILSERSVRSLALPPSPPHKT